MKRKKERKKGETIALEMTPMIDVVFQLLIFFIVTLRQEDIFSHLDVVRPSPDPNQPVDVEPPQLLEIMVFNEQKLGGDGFAFQGQQIRLADLERNLKRIAAYSSNVSVIIKCTGDSRHANLVKLLDVCAGAGLKNLAVFSM